MTTNHYTTLGILPTASGEEVDVAFRSLTKALSGVEGTAAILRSVTDAWLVLSDPAARAAYDAGLLGASDAGLVGAREIAPVYAPAAAARVAPTLSPPVWSPKRATKLVLPVAKPSVPGGGSARKAVPVEDGVGFRVVRWLLQRCKRVVATVLLLTVLVIAISNVWETQTVNAAAAAAKAVETANVRAAVVAEKAGFVEESAAAALEKAAVLQNAAEELSPTFIDPDNPAAPAPSLSDQTVSNVPVVVPEGEKNATITPQLYQEEPFHSMTDGIMSGLGLNSSKSVVVAGERLGLISTKVKVLSRWHVTNNKNVDEVCLVVNLATTVRTAGKLPYVVNHVWSLLETGSLLELDKYGLDDPNAAHGCRPVDWNRPLPDGAKSLFEVQTKR